MSAKYTPPDACFPDEIEDSLEDIIREEAARRCPVGFPSTNFAEKMVEVVLTPRVRDGIVEAYGAGTISEQEIETMAIVISEFIDAENPRLRAECYDLVFRLGLKMGVSQDSIAKDHGIGRAAVSKECRRIVREFKLPPARGMKSETAVGVYRERQKKKHQERRENYSPWKFAEEFANGMNFETKTSVRTKIVPLLEEKSLPINATQAQVDDFENKK
jgi:hypothetical protein